MTPESARVCSTISALSEMLDTASRRLRKATLPGASPKTPDEIEAAKAAVASLEQRIADHRSTHGC